MKETRHALRYHLGRAAALAIREAEEAATKHEPLNSYHEGYAVLMEEVEELWNEIKERNQDPQKIRDEAIQVASLALRIAATANKQSR